MDAFPGVLFLVGLRVKYMSLMVVALNKNNVNYENKSFTRNNEF